jgi:two-component system response regulator FixJ
MPTQPTVFVIDDDVAVRESLRMSLQLAGRSVEVFESAAAFLAGGGAFRHGCLVTDIRMPDVDGLELQEELVRRKSSLPVIVITGHGDIPLAVRAMRAGAVDFLEKPFAREVLLAVVERALEAGERTSAEAHDAQEIGSRIASLTPREREVFELVAAGKQSKLIAYELGVAPRTVEVHRGRMMNKLKARSMQELVRIAIAAGAVRI